VNEEQLLGFNGFAFHINILINKNNMDEQKQFTPKLLKKRSVEFYNSYKNVME
jgi:putative GTP pyrophosphokinase